MLVGHPCDKPLRALGYDDDAVRAHADPDDALEMLIGGEWHRTSWSSLDAAQRSVGRADYTWQPLPDDLRDLIASPLGGDWYTTRTRTDVVRERGLGE